MREHGLDLSAAFVEARIENGLDCDRCSVATFLGKYTADMHNPQLSTAQPKVPPALPVRKKSPLPAANGPVRQGRPLPPTPTPKQMDYN